MGPNSLYLHREKSQGNLSKRINQGHLNGLVIFWKLRDKYNKNIAKESALIAGTPKGRTSRFSSSTVVTPECSQEFTQAPTGVSKLVRFMTTCLSLTQNTNSNNKTDNETTVSSLEEEILDKELSQQLTQKTDFQKELGRPTYRQKEKSKPYDT